MSLRNLFVLGVAILPACVVRGYGTANTGGQAGLSTQRAEPGRPGPTPPTPGRPPEITDANATSMLALGEAYTCMLSIGGQIRCFGNNHYGALGVGSRDKSADGFVTGIEGQVTAIAAGGYQTCALTAAGQVWCWGSNIEGQIGNGSVAPSEQPVLQPTRVAGLDNVRSIHLGSKTSCARAQDGALYCWGLNQQKQIDDSSTKQITRPTRISAATGAELVAVGNYHICWTIGGRVSCRGTLAPIAGDLASLANVTALTAGYQHSCAIHDGGKVSCWGGDYLGVLGQGNQCPDKSGECTSKLRPPALVPGLAPNPIDLRGNTYHSCVRYADGSVACWGNNQGGRFASALPMEPWNRAYVLPGVVADTLYVGGIHTCTVRAGAMSCIGNDYANFVPRTR